MVEDASGAVATLPDGRSVHCVNAYEVGFGWHEIVSDDLTRRGLSLPADGTYVDVGANIGLFCHERLDVEVHRGPEELRSFIAELDGHGYRSVVEDHPMAQGGALVFHIYAHRP